MSGNQPADPYRNAQPSDQGYPPPPNTQPTGWYGQPDQHPRTGQPNPGSPAAAQAGPAQTGPSQGGPSPAGPTQAAPGGHQVSQGFPAGPGMPASSGAYAPGQPDQDASYAGEPAGRPVGHQGARVEVNERPAWAINGFAGLIGSIVAIGLGVLLCAMSNGAPLMLVPGVLLAVIGAIFLGSTTVVQPGDTKVVQFFGRYIGTVRRTGLVMTLPLTTRRKVSVKVQNFETNELKVNDADGNPVNIAGIIVWQVADTAKATFSVEDYRNFVLVQAESALRHVATSHPYDAPAELTSLRGSTDQVAGEIATEVAARVAIAGIEVVETRISNLAYAPEIAQAMLQRQQASAIIAAREKIVEGAVTMVHGALSRLEEEAVVTLDEERKAAMVSNLLVVLCGESRATPIVNAGSLYH